MAEGFRVWGELGFSPDYVLAVVCVVFSLVI